MSTLSKVNIINGNVIEDIDVYQMVDALTYQQAYDLLIKGNVAIGSGSTYPGTKLYISGGAFRVAGDTYIAPPKNITPNILYYDTSSGKISYGDTSIFVAPSSFNALVAQYNIFTASYYSDSASFDSRFISASLGVSASLIYAGNSPATRNVGGITVGQSLNGYTLGNLLQQIVAPYTAPTLSLITLTPTVSNYNQQNVTYNVTFRWLQNVGTTSFSLAQIQYKRNSDLVWTNLTTAVVGPSNQKDASASVTINTSGTNNDSVLFQCIFVDSQTNTTPAATSTFLPYIAPLAVFSQATVPATNSGGYLIRSITVPYTASISGSVENNTPNVSLSQYKVSRDYNDSIWVDVNSLTAISGSGGPISPTIIDSTQPTNRNTVRYLGFVKDSYVTAGQYVNYISSTNIMQPVLYGMVTGSTVASVNLGSLSTVQHGSGSGQIVYTNTAADKVVNNLTMVASSNRFCIAFDNSYGTLTTFFEEGSNLDLISNFTIGTQSVTFADGTTKTYTVALYNLVVVSGTYRVNIG